MKKVLKNKEILKSKVAKIVIAIFVIALAGYCVFTFASNTVKNSQLNAKSQALAVQLEEIEDENSRIEAIISSDNKDEYIEEKAREKGYVKSGETVFYDISSSK